MPQRISLNDNITQDEKNRIGKILNHWRGKTKKGPNNNHKNVIINIMVGALSEDSFSIQRILEDLSRISPDEGNKILHLRLDTIKEIYFRIYSDLRTKSTIELDVVQSALFNIILAVFNTNRRNLSFSLTKKLDKLPEIMKFFNNNMSSTSSSPVLRSPNFLITHLIQAVLEIDFPDVNRITQKKIDKINDIFSDPSMVFSGSSNESESYKTKVSIFIIKILCEVDDKYVEELKVQKLQDMANILYSSEDIKDLHKSVPVLQELSDKESLYLKYSLRIDISHILVDGFELQMDKSFFRSNLSLLYNRMYQDLFIRIIRENKPAYYTEFIEYLKLIKDFNPDDEESLRFIPIYARMLVRTFAAKLSEEKLGSIANSFTNFSEEKLSSIANIFTGFGEEKIDFSGKKFHSVTDSFTSESIKTILQTSVAEKIPTPTPTPTPTNEKYNKSLIILTVVAILLILPALCLIYFRREKSKEMFNLVKNSLSDTASIATNKVRGFFKSDSVPNVTNSQGQDRDR